MTRVGEPHTLCWVDLGTNDVDRSQAFYQAVFGWTFDEFTTEQGSYYTALLDGGPVGGMMEYSAEQREQGIPSMWSVFFASTDLAADVARIDEAGGSIIQEPFEIPGGERIAVVADPQGATFALATFTAVGSGAMRWDEPSAAAWIECQTRAVDDAVAFYESFFGWKSQRSGDYVVFELDGEPVAGLMAVPDQVPEEAGSYWFTYWRVDDLEAARTRVTDAGGALATGVMEIEGERFAVVEDVNGSVIGLVEAAATDEPA